MSLDVSTASAIVAVVIAVTALVVALAQVVQQYLVTGQLIRICDSVVYGKMPGQGHRVWEFSQFRFRVVYSIPQISIPAEFWLGVSSHGPSYAKDGLVLPDLLPSESDPADIPKGAERTQWAFWSSRSRTSFAGEASWVSFARAVQHSSASSLRYELVEGDADRCPGDLPVVPMQLSMRDVVTVAIMAGMECTDVSFQHQTLSMQGTAGTITSSRHPVLGSLLHFAAKQPRERHGFRVDGGKISTQWMSRMWDTVTVAGLQYDLRDRRYFEEDEGSWIRLSGDRSIVQHQRVNFESTDSETRPMRRNQYDFVPSSQHLRYINGASISSIAVSQSPEALQNRAIDPSSPILHRQQDGAWSFSQVVSQNGQHGAGLQETYLPPTNSITARPHSSHSWLRRCSEAFWKFFTKFGNPRVSVQDANILPVSMSEQVAGNGIKANRDDLINTDINNDAQFDDHITRTTSWQSRASRWSPWKIDLQGYVKAKREVERRKVEDTTDLDNMPRVLLLDDNEEPKDQGPGIQHNAKVPSIEHERYLETTRTEELISKWQEIVERRREERERKLRNDLDHSEPQQYQRRSSVSSNTSRRTKDGKDSRSRSKTSNVSRSHSKGSQGDERQERRPKSRDSGRSGVRIQGYGNEYELRRGRTIRRSSSVRSEKPQQEGRRWKPTSVERQYGVTDSMGRRRTVSPSQLNSRKSRNNPFGTRSNQSSSERSRPRGRQRTSSLSSSNRSYQGSVGMIEYGETANDESSHTREPISLGSMQANSDNKGRVHIADPTREEPISPSALPAGEQIILTAPIKGILRRPREKFPEDPAPIREGVAPLKNAGQNGIPPNARWTKISRRIVNPEALTLGNERFEERSDHVVVLRVLTREEIQSYATKTAEIREARMLAMLQTYRNTSLGPRQWQWRGGDVRGRKRSLSMTGVEEYEPLHADHPPRGLSSGSMDPPDSIDFDDPRSVIRAFVRNILDQSHDLEMQRDLSTESDARAKEPSTHPERRRQPSNHSENSLRFEDEMIFLQCEDILKSGQKRTKQCSDIVVALTVFRDDQDDNNHTRHEVAMIHEQLKSLETTLQILLSKVELDCYQKHVAQFVVSEMEVLVRNLKTNLTTLETEFSLTDIRSLSPRMQRNMWDRLLLEFNDRYSCSLSDHLRSTCRFSNEILRILQAGQYSSTRESDRLKAQIPKVNEDSLGSSLESSLPLTFKARSLSLSPSSSTSPRRWRSPRGFSPPARHQRQRSTSITDADDSYESDTGNSSLEDLSGQEKSSWSEESSTLASTAKSQVEPKGSVNWLWLSQADILPGFFATPWKGLFSEAVCIGAISVILNGLDAFFDNTSRCYVKTQPANLAWMLAGKTTYPSYALNSRGGVVVKGVYKPVKLAAFAQCLPPLELLHNYTYQVARFQSSSTISVGDSIAELMGLDSWLALCGRQAEIYNGRSNLLRRTPALVVRIMESFEFEFANVDRNIQDGGFAIIRAAAESLRLALVEEGLSEAEQVFATVALLRTAKVGLCVVRGTGTDGLRDVFLRDVQVYLA